MRRVAATVNVISLNVDGRPMGVTATAVSSLSMDPPSPPVCLNRAASVHASMAAREAFRVHTLQRSQEDLPSMFPGPPPTPLANLRPGGATPREQALRTQHPLSQE